MTMHTMYLKEHEEVVQNPGGAVPWWSGLGSQSVAGESFAQFRSPSMENPSHGDQIATAKQLEKGNTSQFTIFPGDRKTSANMSIQSAPPEYQGRFELGFGQPLMCTTKYPYGSDQYFGLFSTCGPQITGRIMLPLNLATDDGPIYVNAKQYHGIIRRRLSRAKAESVNKALKARKPYLHLSRHLHAMRRPRGCGGRFLNTKASNGSKGGTEAKKLQHGRFSQSTDSQNSEVLQSDSGNLNSSNEENGNGRSNAFGSEVTSMFSRGNLDPFSFHHLQQSVHPFSGMMNAGHGHAMPCKWVAAAANSCCNLKV